MARWVRRWRSAVITGSSSRRSWDTSEDRAIMGQGRDRPPVSLRGRMTGSRKGRPALTDAPGGTDNADVADVAAAVEAASSALVIALGRAEERVLPRVSVSQLRALLIISRQAPTNLNQLAEELGAIPSSASRLCDRLVAAGLVTRRPGSVDRREVELRVSAEGQRLLDQLRGFRQAEVARVLAGMNTAARHALLAGLGDFQRAA